MRPWFFFVFLSLLGASPLSAQAETPEEQLAAASALFDAGKYPAAAQKLEAFLLKNPKHPKVPAAAFTLARSRVEQKQFAQAIPAYEKVIGGKDTDLIPLAQLGLGEAALTAQKYDRAAIALEAALKANLQQEQAAFAWYGLGQANLQRKQYARAEEAYLQVTRDYPRSNYAEGAWFGAGLAALRQNKGAAARERFRAIVDRYPQSPDRPQALLMMAQMHLTAKEYPQARAAFERMLRDPSAKNADAATLADAEDGLIQALLETKDYAAAADRLTAALNRLPADDPQWFRAQLSLGHCHYRRQQYAPALAAYTAAAKSPQKPVAAQGFYWAGNTALALDRPAEAAPQFAKLVARFPQHELASRAQRKAGDAYLAAKQNTEAAGAYRVVLERYPRSPDAAEARKALAELTDSLNDPAQLNAVLKNAAPMERHRGTLRATRLLLESKKTTEALPLLTALLKEKPVPEIAAEGNYLLGVVYESQRKSAPAAVALAEAVRLNPAAEWAGDAQGRLAWLYLDGSQPEAAEKAATAALKRRLEPQPQTQARLALVQAQLDLKKWDAALEGCRQLMAGSPTPETATTVLFTQAWVAEKRGKPEEALPLWERLLQEQPKSAHAAEALLHIGDGRFRAKQLEEARDLYARLLSDFPKSPPGAEARFKLGSALYNLDRPAEAAAEFNAVAIDKSAGSYAPEALYWAGVALEKAGQREEAIQRLSRLVTQYPKSPRIANARIRLAALKAKAP